MKNLYKILVFILFSGALVSCEDMNDLHEKYTKEGEIIYAKKTDTLIAFPGRERIMIYSLLTGAFNVNEIVVNWNNGSGHKVFPYSKSEQDTDTLNLMIDGLEEGNYQFEVYTKDGDDNRSVVLTLFGTAYGETYRSNLIPRGITGFLHNGTDAVLKFGSSDENQRSTEVKYVNTNNEEMIESISELSDTLELPGYAVKTPVLYRTYYVPTSANEEGIETSIDRFESDWKTLVLPEYILPILESVTFEEVLGGLIAQWDNPDGMDIKLDFFYTVDGEEKMHTVQSSETEGEATISGMEGGEQMIRVFISDPFDFSYGDDFAVAPLEAAKLDKTNWTIIDFSSEEPEEGPPNGLATAAIDDDLSTFWHSQWADSQPNHPHYFTVDMGSEKTVASFEVFRRQNNGSGQTKHKFYVSLDGENWTDLGTFEMKQDTNDGQSYGISTTPTARYFKYETVEGNSNFAMLAEINVYGLE